MINPIVVRRNKVLNKLSVFVAIIKGKIVEEVRCWLLQHGYVDNYYLPLVTCRKNDLLPKPVFDVSEIAIFLILVLGYENR